MTRATRAGARRAAQPSPPGVDRLLIVNEHHLSLVLTEYLQHYNTARLHRALGQLALAQAHNPPTEIDLAEHRIG